MIPIFYGHVTKGRVKLDRPDTYLVWLSGLEGKPVELTIQKERHIRTLNQNRWYWGVILELISQHTGEDKEDLHEHFLDKFASRIDRIEGKQGGAEEIRVKERSHIMSTVRFTEYLENIRRWAAEFLGLYIPDPEDVNYEIG